MELSTALVFRTIHPTVFAFVHKAAGSKERDRRWRRKARRVHILSTTHCVCVFKVGYHSSSDR